VSTKSATGATGNSKPRNGLLARQIALSAYQKKPAIVSEAGFVYLTRL
jgi:hypothetical protein